MVDAATTTCTHHWVLARPEDDVIRGRCKRCGATREYPASVEGASRQGVYDEAASLDRTVSRRPEVGGNSSLGGLGRS